MAEPQRTKNEITLALGTYVLTQDTTNGRIKTHVGPTVVTLTNNDTPIIYQKGKRGQGKFIPMPNIEDAVRDSLVVPEGFYAIVMNPAVTGKFPSESQNPNSPELQIGHKVVIKGPTMFPLWPGQHAVVVRGHSLRSNQYVLCRVYNENEARKNWASTTITTREQVDPAKEGEVPEGDAPKKPAEDTTTTRGVLALPPDLTVGSLFIIKGTVVSFYIPPTGVSVVPDGTDEDGVDKYIRDAVTLEQLEYCILVDEDGNKRIPRGPDVVFPEPTETFVKGKNGELKYRAIELSPIQGVHIKVTKGYRDDTLNKEMKEGDEFFLTGDKCPIYFPRVEHAIVRYGEMGTKYFGTAIPAGEGRYVMSRNTGFIKTVLGPAMLLPNPVDEVVIRRILSQRECGWWYPGNVEAASFNMARASELEATQRTAGKLLGGEKHEDYMAKGSSPRGRGKGYGSDVMRGIMGTPELAPQAMYMSVPNAPASLNSMVDSDSTSAAGEQLSRSTTYTPPRTLTLNTKYEGVPRISIWTGYAVMVVNSKGERRVEVGPKTILLDYDEVLEIMYLSTGKPKNTDKLLETPYLQVVNNKVSDVITVETLDHVEVQLKVAYHVDFTGESTKWWNITNYVKHVCDHMRSALKGVARKMSIEEFYQNALDVLRKVVLGDEGKGTLFPQNGMHVLDVELLALTLPDPTVGAALAKTQKEAVSRAILITESKERLKATEQVEQLKRKEAAVLAETEIVGRKLQVEKLGASLTVSLAEIETEIKKLTERAGMLSKQEEERQFLFDKERARDLLTTADEVRALAAKQEVQVGLLMAEAEAQVKRFGALQEGMGEALLTISGHEVMTKVAEATSVQRIVGGNNVVETMTRMFDGLGVGSLFRAAITRIGAKGAPASTMPESPTRR